MTFGTLLREAGTEDIGIVYFLFMGESNPSHWLVRASASSVLTQFHCVGERLRSHHFCWIEVASFFLLVCSLHSYPPHI